MKDILELATDQKNPGICPNFIQVNRKKKITKSILRESGKPKKKKKKKGLSFSVRFKYILVGLAVEHIACPKAREGPTPGLPLECDSKTEENC